MAKNVRIGSLIVTNRKDGTQSVSIGLGSKNKRSEYDTSVELIVRDSKGNVVAKQVDGYIELTDPRTKPASLLKAGIITEDVALRMTEDAKRLSDKIKYVLDVKRI